MINQAPATFTVTRKICTATICRKFRPERLTGTGATAQQEAQGVVVPEGLVPGRHAAAVRATEGHAVVLVRAEEPGAVGKEGGHPVLLVDVRSFPTSAHTQTKGTSIPMASIRQQG